MILFKKASLITLMLVVTLTLVASLAWAGDIDEEPPVEVVIDSGVTPADTIAAEAKDKVIVYYLHGNRRCATCMKLEAYSKEAIETGFVNELEQGTLEWRAVNYEEEENEHFADAYELYTKAVILSRIVKGEEAGWKNLDKIWDLVGDHEKFIEYVQSETKTFLTEDAQ